MRRVVALLAVLLAAGCTAPAAEPQMDNLVPEEPESQDAAPGSTEPEETMTAEVEPPASETAPAEAQEEVAEPEPVAPSPPVCVEWGDDAPTAPLVERNASGAAGSGEYVERVGAWTLTAQPAFVETVPGAPVSFALRLEHEGEAPAATLRPVGWTAFANSSDDAHSSVRHWSVVEGETVIVGTLVPPGERVAFTLYETEGELLHFEGPLVAPVADVPTRAVPALTFTEDSRLPLGLTTCAHGDGLRLTFVAWRTAPGGFDCAARMESAGDWHLVQVEGEWTLVGRVVQEFDDACAWRGVQYRVVVELPVDAPRPQRVVVWQEYYCFGCFKDPFQRFEAVLSSAQPGASQP